MGLNADDLSAVSRFLIALNQAGVDTGVTVGAANAVILNGTTVGTLSTGPSGYEFDETPPA